MMREFVVRTVVTWGRAYLGVLRVDNKAVFGGESVVFLRDENQDGFDHHNPLARTDVFYFHKIMHLLQSFPYQSWNWIYEEQHIKCVWRLSERVAKTLAIDHVQVDVAVVRGHPSDCLVVDISLLATDIREIIGLRHHRHVTSIWAEPLVSRNYKQFGNNKNHYLRLISLGLFHPELRLF